MDYAAGDVAATPAAPIPWAYRARWVRYLANGRCHLVAGCKSFLAPVLDLNQPNAQYVIGEFLHEHQGRNAFSLPLTPSAPPQDRDDLLELSTLAAAPRPSAPVG